MAERYPVVLVHGYSDKGKSFAPWKAFLESKNYSAEEISICNYQSLTNEVTIKDPLRVLTGLCALKPTWVATSRSAQ
jgi:triacylglycerol esterase/lipase EstA (alpha/beta hydrolase family)